MKETVHFVLVHGASHGARCWCKMYYLLKKAGHEVTCIDLAGAGSSPVDPNSLLSFRDYNMPLLDFLSKLSDSKEVVLVGHSAGGLSVTDACRKFPQKIHVAVYVAATMLPLGFSSQNDMELGCPKLGEQDWETNYGMGTHNPPTTILFKKHVLRDNLYQLSPLEDVRMAYMLLRPFLCIALHVAKFPEENMGKKKTKEKEVPRVYIKTVHDKTLTEEQQDGMITYWPPNEVYSVESDHSPFFSAPLPFTRMLLHIASSFTKKRFI